MEGQTVHLHVCWDSLAVIFGLGYCKQTNRAHNVGHFNDGPKVGVLLQQVTWRRNPKAQATGIVTVEMATNLQAFILAWRSLVHEQP